MDLNQRSPKQDGLLYAWGIKNSKIRQHGTDGCTEELFAFDCSGLVYAIAADAGITIPNGTSQTQLKLESWKPPKGLIPDAWGLKIVDVTGEPIQAGDIVGWSDHIGIAYVTSSQIKRVISSMGGEGTCEKNASKPRGPQDYTVLGVNKGQPNKVLRLAIANTFAVHIDVTVTGLGTPTALNATLSIPSGSPTTPSGTITFTNGAGVICSAPVQQPSGFASCTGAITSLPTTLTATYGGDGNWPAVSSSVFINAIPGRYTN